MHNYEIGSSGNVGPYSKIITHNFIKLFMIEMFYEYCKYTLLSMTFYPVSKGHHKVKRGCFSGFKESLNWSRWNVVCISLSSCIMILFVYVIMEGWLLHYETGKKVKTTRPNFFQLCIVVTSYQYNKYGLFSMTMIFIQNHRVSLNFK